MVAFLLSRHKHKKNALQTDLEWHGVKKWYFIDDGIDIGHPEGLMCNKHVGFRIVGMVWQGEEWYACEVTRFGRKHYIGIETESQR